MQFFGLIMKKRKRGKGVNARPPRTVITKIVFFDQQKQAGDTILIMSPVLFCES